MKNILIVGLGYVGLSTTFLLSKRNKILGLDSNKNHIKKLELKELPFKENLMQEYISDNNQNISFSSKKIIDFDKFDFIFLCLPTNFDENISSFDTSIVSEYVKEIATRSSRHLNIIIKSTVPIGYSNELQNLFPNLNIIFSPEFLRENSALEDSLKPSRLIFGGASEGILDNIVELYESCIEKKCEILRMDYDEAEAVKLFSNAFLATRVAFFNDIDTFAMKNNFSSKNIIKGLSLDSRIGDFYNNPSFGYGGYCLPKDTKQLRSQLDEYSNSIVSASVRANNKRKNFIARFILEKTKNNQTIGFYNLAMKKGSDNCKNASIREVIELVSKKREVIIYDDKIFDISFNDFALEDNFIEFEKKSDLIVTNRLDKRLKGTKTEVFSRDLFYRD